MSGERRRPELGNTLTKRRMEPRRRGRLARTILLGTVAVAFSLFWVARELELDTEEAFDRARRAGLQLVAAGADVVVLGCTGMTHMQDRLGEALGVPVIDPCSAAVDEARRAIAEEDS